MSDNKQTQQYGVITEQGDLGLGFEPIKESEQEKIKDNNQKK